MLIANQASDDHLLGILDHPLWVARAGSVALGLPSTLRKALCRAYAASGESRRAASIVKLATDNIRIGSDQINRLGNGSVSERSDPTDKVFQHVRPILVAKVAGSAMRVFRNSPLLSKSPARPAFDRVAVTARQTAQTIAILLVISASFTGGAAAARSSGMERVSSEPFGLPTVKVPSGPLVTKWRNVERDIRQDELLLARCAVDRPCGSAAALQLMDIADAAGRREGRTRVGQINRAINFAIRPTSDLAQYGVPDLWTAPIQTLTTGAGDCEDYAIAKYVALEEAGVAEEDLRLLVVRDTRRREDHAMVAVRLDGRWLLLDNRWLALIEDRELENYLPMFEMNRDGVRRFLAAAQPRVLPRGATEAASASLRSQAQPPEHPS